ncbi:hypothetical protein DIU31_024040 [Mucilaginibacter rubeus]|uniref:Uncharacterized protein n=1 Tax=Mucilaginibacter rubeus TaxID=2027860 RepID=A0AAE6JJ89_9SPHI|nr:MULTISPECIES: hypothetical protein [Mucilaginibacter]QEM06433.1 hypothetical protein DIU31_024040 [Mucilaginibacter rubeus]QEM19017.1 hypothetical protein DIU38_024270 [Mucilaginibacter gossypii]QTE44441.1 hypothetical protein J3L19_03435 [Mucilaginibacter rubeus]QTE51040.1 hypothetical protein J3L21_03410 [Mucilaginibacter rubeus]QTE56123.1 hypothetical protein J3L23_28650 [Mucilaginibacter rubeus]
MKTLNSFTNVDKAKMIHGLFIHEIPGFLAFTRELSEYMRTHPDEVRKVWKNQLFGVDFWFELSEEADRKIKRYGKQLEKSSSVFADQLFDGYGALYLNHCLVTYTEQGKHGDPKFKTAIDLFFNP